MKLSRGLRYESLPPRAPRLSGCASGWVFAGVRKNSVLGTGTNRAHCGSRAPQILRHASGQAEEAHFDAQ